MRRLSSTHKMQLSAQAQATSRVPTKHQRPVWIRTRQPKMTHGAVAVKKRGTVKVGAQQAEQSDKEDPKRPSSLAPVTSPTIFGRIESMIQATLNSQQPGSRKDWEELEGCWVLPPPDNKKPEAVVHFLGGAFVGAAPQITYRLFLEALASRGVLVITTPYATGFDQLIISDEIQYKYDRCIRALEERNKAYARLPVYGVGHSLGSLLHLVVNSRHTPKRAGNALLSFNNRPATDVIPFLSPLIAPSARMLGPLLTQLAASPLRATLEVATAAVRGLSPGLVKQVLPLMEQLTPIYLDVSQGRQEFTPTPEETRALVQRGYQVKRNLLIRFKDDNIDQSVVLMNVLEGTGVAGELDLNVRTLEGNHLRPLQQNVVDLPPEVARMANSAVQSGGSLLGRMAEMAGQMGVPPSQTSSLEDLSKGVATMASMLGGATGGPVTDNVQQVADEVAAWMGVGNVVVKGGRALPASAASA